MTRPEPDPTDPIATPSHHHHHHQALLKLPCSFSVVQVVLNSSHHAINTMLPSCRCTTTIFPFYSSSRRTILLYCYTTNNNQQPAIC
ncbi:hypothetical protein KSS87_016076 [Heliosperma pusillum]|nr:hypothetical protein KSS87_016076 [Heliosperma pusillum]